MAERTPAEKAPISPDSDAAKLIAQMEAMVSELKGITDEIGPALRELKDKIK